MSAKRRVTGISAPLTPSLRYCLMQFSQMAGLPGNRAKPMFRMRAPPGPANGALQILQRGDDGIRFMFERNFANPSLSPVRTRRYSSSVHGMARRYASTGADERRGDRATT